MTGPSRDDSTRLLELITGSWISQALHVAAELRLADHLRDGPRTAAQIAAATGTDEPSLARLLRALCTIDVCRERDDGSFEITAMGSLLGDGTEGSLRHWAMWWGTNLWSVWGHLLYSVKTGKSARASLMGTKGFEHLAHDPKSAEVFNRALAELTRFATGDVVAACDFSRLARIVDVGGGHGELLAAILDANPSASGTVFDLPHAIDGARRLMAERHLAARCEFVAGDFFREAPRGADAYLLKSVLHDWTDADARRILGVCRAAMTGDARLLVVEQVLPDRRSPTATHRSLSRSDLTMLVAHAGRERTESEFRSLLSSAGFDVVGIVPAGPTFSVIEARPSR